MATEPFNKPKLSINRVYTRKGDGGETRLVGGQKVPKILFALKRTALSMS